MESAEIAKLAQPLAIFVIMLSMGMTLVVNDFKRVILFPVSVTIGLVVKILGLPLLMFGILHFMTISPELKVGFILLATCPGGAFSNLVSLLAKGNVALSITLTAIASFITAITIPLIVGYAMTYYLGQDAEIPFQLGKAFLGILLMTVLPVSIGMIIKYYYPIFSERSERPIQILSAISLSAIIAVAIYFQKDQLFVGFDKSGPLAIAFNLLSFFIAFFTCRLVGISRKQSLTVGIEVSVVNSVLGITIASSVLGNDIIGIPSTIYSVAMAPSIIFALIAGNIWSKKGILE